MKDTLALEPSPISSAISVTARMRVQGWSGVRFGISRKLENSWQIALMVSRSGFSPRPRRRKVRMWDALFHGPGDGVPVGGIGGHVGESGRRGRSGRSGGGGAVVEVDPEENIVFAADLDFLPLGFGAAVIHIAQKVAPLKDVISNLLDAGGNGDAGQVFAVCKCPVVDCGDTVGEDEAGEAG